MVDFTLTDENRLVRASARAFAEAEILPYIREWDEKGEVHREVFARMGELGFLGAPIPEAYGGAGMDYLSFAILCEELERADTSFRVVQSVHVGLNSLALLQWGSEEQRQRWLVPQARGEKLATFGLTEPGVGTDAGNLATTARRDGGVYRLNGQKIWISLADLADHFLVFASVDRAKKHKGVTAFMLERGMAGLTTGTLHGKLGIRAGNTGVINLDDVPVPVENRIGEEGEGFLIAMSAIDQGRFTVAAGAVGLAQACLDASVRYAHERHTFGQEIGEHQLVKQMIAKMARRASRWVVSSSGAPAGSRTRASATPARRASPSGTPPSTRSNRRSTPSRSTARTATRTSSRSSATCAIRRPPSSTRGRASSTRSSRPITRSAIARIGRCAASPGRHRAGNGRRDNPAVAAFSESELTILAALAETFVRGDGEGRARLAADALAQVADPAQLDDLHLVLRAMDSRAVNLLLARRPTRFAAMDPDARERYLLGWAHSRIAQRRSAFGAFRKLLTFLAYADPGGDPPNPNLRAAGYRPDDPPITRFLTTVRPYTLPSAGATDDPLTLDADAVVVGSGAGGGVVAAALATAGRSVVVLEAGPFVTEASMPRKEVDAFDRLYLDHGLVTTWDGSITLLAGTGVGGGTLINWMTCIPAPDDVREEWAAEHGLEGLTGQPWDDDVAAIEAEIGVAEATHIPPKDAIILRGARALGWEAAATRRNASACGDCGSCPFGCPRGTKQSGIRVHLATAHAAGGRIVPEAHVTRVLTEGARAVGVEADVAMGEATRRLVVRAPTVVLAAGALRTPAILQRSGIEHPAIGRYLRRPPRLGGGRPLHGVRRDVARDDAGRALAGVLRRGPRTTRRTSSRRRPGTRGCSRSRCPGRGPMPTPG